MMRYNQHNLKNEQGMTLIMSIFIMSAITIITLSVSYFALQELRTSRASTLTEPAIVAAETAGEQGIWMIKRNVFADNCPADNSTGPDGTTNSLITPSRVVNTKCINYDSTVLDLKPGLNFIFFLYDPSDINGNLCMEVGPPGCLGAQLYSAIRFTHISGTSLISASAVTLDGQPVGAVGIISGDVNIPLNIPRDIPASSDERLMVTISSPDYATVEVDTDGTIGGMPDFPFVDAEGCSSLNVVPDCNESLEIFKRRLNITVPR